MAKFLIKSNLFPVVHYRPPERVCLESIDYSREEMGEVWLTRLQIGMCDHLFFPKKVKLVWVKEAGIILPFYIGPETSLRLEFQIPGPETTIPDTHQLLLTFSAQAGPSI